MMPSLGGLTALSLRRPVLIIVINVLIVLAGLVSLLDLNVRELPDVDRPIVTIQAVYDGASPSTMDAEVTAKLEGAVARVSGVRSIDSSSEENNMRIRVEFSPGVVLNDAANDLREAVNRVSRTLPDEVDQVLVIKADNDARAIVQLVATSNTLSQQALTERVERDIVPGFLSIDGVADVQLSGGAPRELRVLFDPARLAAYRLSVSDAIVPLRTMNFDIPSGSYGSTNQDLLVRANASTVEPEAVRKIVIRDNVHVGDVASVFFAAKTPDSYSLFNGRTVLSLGIVRQAGANTIAIANEVQARLERFNAQTKDVQLVKNSDDSIFIKGALSEVLLTLLFSIGVVLVVIALFLGQIKTVWVPAVTMPVSLIGTLATMWMVGFSVNLLTLLALVLATGLIVDDAIVVLENIQRRRSQGLPGMAAAVLGTRQVFFAVIATSVTLVAVFLPIAFLPGDTGRLFREFGLVLSMAIVISTFVALTLCPMMAAYLVDEHQSHTGRLGAAVARLNRTGASMASFYFRTLNHMLAHRVIALLIALGVAVAGALGFGLLNQELLPSEDRGRLAIRLTAPDGASLEYTGKQAEAVEAVLRKYKDRGMVTDVFTLVGRGDKNRVYTIATLPDWKDRDFSQKELAKKVNADLANLPGAQVRVAQESSLAFAGSGAGIQVALLGNDYDQLAVAADQLGEALKKQIPVIEDVRVQYDTSQPELSFEIDRVQANALGVPIEQISQTLRVMVNEYKLLDLSVKDQAVPVVLGSVKGVINNPNDLLNLFLVSNTGSLVPLNALIKVQEKGVAAELDRHVQRRAVDMDIGVPPGIALSETLDQIRAVSAAMLPQGIELLLLGEAASLNDTSLAVAITFGVALLVVFLVLAAQFESIGSALIVIFTVPFGLAAAVFALLITGQTLNLYSQIGLVMLIGLMTKNAILMVEMMDQIRDEGHDIDTAIREGVRLRLRPVMMTVLATVLGSVPLVFTSGPGAEAREAIGWVIVGGLGLSTLFTLYLSPLGYALLARFVKPRAQAGKQLEEELTRFGDAKDQQEVVP